MTSSTATAPGAPNSPSWSRVKAYPSSFSPPSAAQVTNPSGVALARARRFSKNALRGRPEESRGFAEIALRFCEAGNRLGEPNALAALAMAAALEPTPDWEEAAALMERCRAAAEEVGSPSVAAILYYQYATCLVGRGEKTRATPYLKRAMPIFTRMKMEYWESEARRLQGARTRRKGSR